MNVLFEAALEVQQFSQQRNWQFCVIRGLAVVRWGRPRTTQDVDICLLTGFGSEEQYIDPLLNHFESRIPNARQFALDSRILLVKASNSVPLDISLAAVPFEAQVITRASAFDYAEGVSLVTASAEDLVVLKSFAARSQDWADVEGILERQRAKLDWDYIMGELSPLCELKDSPQIVSQLEQLRQKTEAE